MKVVALDAQPQDQQFFTHLLAPAATVQQAPLPGERPHTTGAAVPVWLGVLATLFAVSLAATELWSARLTWRPA